MCTFLTYAKVLHHIFILIQILTANRVKVQTYLFFPFFFQKLTASHGVMCCEILDQLFLNNQI